MTFYCGSCDNGCVVMSGFLLLYEGVQQQAVTRAVAAAAGKVITERGAVR